MKLSEAIRQYHLQMRSDCKSEHTINSYLRDFNNLLAHLGRDTDLNSLTPAIVNGFIIEWSLAIERKPNTINRTKSAVKSFFTWAWELDYIERNLAKTVKVKRVGRRIPDYLTLPEQRVLLETIEKGKNRHYYRDQVLFMLFLETGLRLSEVLNLNIGDINLTERYLLVRHSKGGVEMKKTLPDNLCGVLQEYITFRGAFTAATDALFISSQNMRISKGQVSRLLKHYLHEAGIGKSVSVRMVN